MQQTEQEYNQWLMSSIAYYKNRIKIIISVYGNNYQRESVYNWFKTFRFFKPTNIMWQHNGQLYKKRYSEALLKSSVLDTGTTSLCLRDNKDGYMEASITAYSGCFRVDISLDLWLNKKKELINNYQETFIDLGGCFGYIVNSFDEEIIQNPSDIRVYKRYRLSDFDFPGINQIPIIPLYWLTPENAIYQFDPSFLPGHTEYYDKLAFTTAPYMWFGPDYNRFFSEEKLKHYRNCVENIEVAIGYRRICLWNDIREYNAPLYRERQWDFRNEIELDRVLKDLGSKPFVPKDDKIKPDPTIEFFTGDFQHGGTLLAKLYIDDKGRRCTKSTANAYIQREMKGNTIVWQEVIVV